MTAPIANSPGQVAQMLGQGSWRHITSQEAAKVIADPQEFRFLEPFLAQESSIGLAAQTARVSPSLMYRRVKKLEALGLIEVVKTNSRKGKPIKLYRSVADAFFVPFRFTPMETLEQIIQAMDYHHRTAFFRSWMAHVQEAEQEMGLEVGLRCFRAYNGKALVMHALGPEEAGEPVIVLRFLEPHRPALWNSLNHLDLEFDQAKQLQLELYELLMRYFNQSKPSENSRRYFLGLTLAPL